MSAPLNSQSRKDGWALPSGLLQRVFGKGQWSKAKFPGEGREVASEFLFKPGTSQVGPPPQKKGTQKEPYLGSPQPGDGKHMFDVCWLNSAGLPQTTDDVWRPNVASGLVAKPGPFVGSLDRFSVHGVASLPVAWGPGSGCVLDSVWVNYGDLTRPNSPQMVVDVGNIPPITLFQVGEVL